MPANQRQAKKSSSSSSSSSSNVSNPARRIEDKQRLQRVMAAAGIGSRRECELIIQEGRVEVDGEIVVTLGVKVDPQQQKIFVDGQRLTPERLEYYMLNKPPGVVSTSRDPSGRARVIDLIKTDQRVYNVGRLDQSSEGLILVTNDGHLANQLTHPRYGIEKKYHVQVDGVPATAQLRSLEEGIYIAEGKAKATSAKLLKKTGATSWLEIVLSEGRNREIRRLLAKIGHRVRVLRRVAIGPLKLADLPLGAHRRLTTQELKMLKRSAASLQPLEKDKARKPKKKLVQRKPKPVSGAPSSMAAHSQRSRKGVTQPPTKPAAAKKKSSKASPGKPINKPAAGRATPKTKQNPAEKQKQIRSKRRVNPKGRSR